MITERPGRLRILRQGKLLPQPVEGVPKVFHSGQGGLLEVMPHPNFASNRLLYITLLEAGAHRGRLEDGTDSRPLRERSPDAGEEIFDAVSKGRGHYSGKIAFDKNGFLFLTLGDRQVPPEGNLEAHPAQDLTNHHGKIVRLHDDGRVPTDNPFVSRAGARPEIWSYGHRNVQGLAIHPETGDLWADEHGPQGGDELNRIEPGKNYGWPVIGFGVNYTTGLAIHTGTHRDGMEQPVQIWVPSIGISGMMFYTGDKFPQWTRQHVHRRHERPAAVASDAQRPARRQRGDAGAADGAASGTSARGRTASSTSSPTIATARPRRSTGSNRKRVLRRTPNSQTPTTNHSQLPIPNSQQHSIGSWRLGVVGSWASESGVRGGACLYDTKNLSMMHASPPSREVHPAGAD